jgi:hypothetical protein
MNLSNSDGFDDDSNEAVDLGGSLMMEKVTVEFPTVHIKTRKSVHFSGVIESHESDRRQEEVELTWFTVS